MADMFATAADLAAALQQAVDTSTATLLIEAGTAVVQAAAGGQRIIEATDSITIMGTSDSWLALPQVPVTAVSSVVMDGITLTLGAAGSGAYTYRRHGSRLWRGDGWQTYFDEPSTIVVGS